MDAADIRISDRCAGITRSVGHLTDGGDEGEEEDAVGESETVRWRQWRRVGRRRWGRGRRCGREGIWGKMVGAMEVVAPLYMMGRFGHVHGHVLPHDRGFACAHVYAAPLVS